MRKGRKGKRRDERKREKGEKKRRDGNAPGFRAEETGHPNPSERRGGTVDERPDPPCSLCLLPNLLRGQRFSRPGLARRRARRDLSGGWGGQARLAAGNHRVLAVDDVRPGRELKSQKAQGSFSKGAGRFLIFRVRDAKFLDRARSNERSRSQVGKVHPPGTTGRDGRRE